MDFVGGHSKELPKIGFGMKNQLRPSLLNLKIFNSENMK
jgi:hypothetical protein